ncbi:hypothetical protein SAMD00019534_122300 [Acytostelium subglobosum LB1]|uniref:hypothetical protein n=1 Tax=Acytostelium subglobosum LB1 TaxID=1410327 RepID=UPI000644B061|nr:hypothetical protein SAMD00019534_122300 [Acytostelium subglobosum LB1]GAM29054.1 hypothetical protein SAMD00019534_122300 [Acytostelium subglobosum LB1]|eukprot:XP_012748060.1 hypothetical protein SAMD00019534_122300 [Acytostelium subglobosum LB1]
MLEEHAAQLTELLQGAPLPSVPLPKSPSCGYEMLKRSPHARRPAAIMSDANVINSAAAVDTHPMRIVFNNTFLSSSTNKQTCSSVGQIVSLNNDNGHATSYSCTAQDVLTPGLINVIKNTLLPHITSTYGDVLSVTGPARQIGTRPFYGCAGEDYTIDLKNGFEGDYMFYVTAHPTLDDGVIAYATACLQKSDTKAPIVGLINFAPKFFANFANASYAKENQAEWHTFFAVSLHEATHALGFASDMYSDFATVTPSSPATKNVVSNEVSPTGAAYTVQKTFLTTPAVKAFIQDHYGCNSMEGAELESNGGSGTAGSHWSALRIGEELMLGYAQASAPLTGLTLSLLKDSGWYTTSQTDDVKPLMWGLKKGCDFALKPCSPTTWGFEGYWTAGLTANKPLVSCTATRAGVGYTSVVTYKSPLSAEYQHFSDNTWGSINGQLFSYCPFNSAEVYSQSYYCFDTNKQPNANGEVFGDSSACFISVSNASATTTAPTCYPQRCTNKQLQFQYANTWYTCQAPGSVVSVSQTLSVRCPADCNALCQYVANHPNTSGGSTTGLSTTTASTTTGELTSTTTSSTTTKPSSSTFVQVNAMMVLVGLVLALII